MSKGLSPLKISIFIVALIVSFFVGRNIDPTFKVESTTLDMKEKEDGSFYYIYKGDETVVNVISTDESNLLPEKVDLNDTALLKKLIREEKDTEYVKIDGVTGPMFIKYNLKKHYGIWSLLPAFVAILLCWLTKEPLVSLFGGIISGAFLLGYYDITDQVFMESFKTKNVASILLLYLWMLGGLLGMWNKTGAAKAFANYMTIKFVRGPRSAKLVAWFLGVIFFQGGTVSTVLVGTTVKPLADKEKISHEELSYIVDSTASPIASQLAFNAWPGYVQSFIYVGGVAWLATESDRITFFFKSVPFCFYAIFAVLGTFLLSIDKPIFLGRKMKDAIKRARTTGQLDRPGSDPLSAKELEEDTTPDYYKPHIIDFFFPLLTLLIIAIGTFIASGSPQVRWAFGASLLGGCILAMIRGMKLNDVIDGILGGIKGVVFGSIILVLAVTLGTMSKGAGGGDFLMEALGGSLPYWILPVILQMMTILIAFSTGSSWGTYAIAFPLAMPLSYAIATSAGLSNPEFYMTICFAAVMDGSVFGDQCSPISDTTVLSSMCTGCDLMDHVTTQIPQASIAAGLAAVCWTSCVLLFA